jgi:lauroyl/myristoyl acyltransferase
MTATNVSPTGNRTAGATTLAPEDSPTPAPANHGSLSDWWARLRRYLTLLAWHGWQRLDAMLPRPARFLVATALGELLYWMLSNKRAAVLDNMAHVLGAEASPGEVRLVAKRSFRNYAKYLSEFAHLPRWTAADLEALMAGATGWEHVDEALADGKGAIFITPHFGNWDVAGWYFGQRHDFKAIVEALHPPELDVLVQGWRKAKGIGIIPLAGAVRGVMRALQHGGIVAIVVDRPTHATGEGVAVRFFGQQTRVPGGAARFALRTGAPVVAAGVWRTPRNTYEAIAMPPMRFQPSVDPAAQETDEARVMQRIMEEIERMIRTHPDQWYMFRRMWPQPRRARWPVPDGDDDRQRGAVGRSSAVAVPVATGMPVAPVTSRPAEMRGAP